MTNYPTMRALKASIVLSRIPIVTPEPPAFAKAYYRYMSELESRLMWTFPWYYYFKKGTLAFRRFSDLQTSPIPRHKGVYYARGLPDVKHNRERRMKQIVNLPETASEQDGVLDTIKPQSRVTEADAKNDETSLARKLDLTLYLLVNGQQGWRFPAFNVADDATSLHEVAEKGLRELGGENIVTWTVSNTPAAVIKEAEPIFLIKSHIIQGRFDPRDKVQFAWLSKNEIADRVDGDYFKKIEVLL